MLQLSLLRFPGSGSFCVSGRESGPEETSLLEEGGGRVPKPAHAGKVNMDAERQARINDIIPPSPEFRDPEDEEFGLRQLFRRPESFQVSQNDFQDWIRVWRMDVSPDNPNTTDIYGFSEVTMKENARKALEQEIEKLGNVKASFGLEVYFRRETQNEKGEWEEQTQRHYFKEEDPHVFTKSNFNEAFDREFDDFIDRIRGEIENWLEQRSGWDISHISIAYVNKARYQPLRGGSYIPLPAKLASKRAIINVKNADNECLKWALKAARFPVQNHAERTSKYSREDGLNWAGIQFPTPLKDINKPEKKNPALVINVYGWEKDHVIVYRISEQPKTIERINLMLLEDGRNTHYCFIQKLSALLYDQTKNRHRRYYCEMCMIGFIIANVLARHAVHCNGVNGRPTKIEMPEKGNNILKFQNHKNNLKAPFAVYADSEALIENIPEGARERTVCTEKTEKHVACGFAFTVV